MKWDALLNIAAELPVVDSNTLRVFGETPKALAVQLQRWVKAGKLQQLRRGIYLLAPRYRRRTVSIETIANYLHSPSYVSMERALQWHGLIPEDVSLVQSVTTGRTINLDTPIGTFSYRHAKQPWFFGYEEIPVADGHALIATREKALLDLVYFSRGEFAAARVEELRLQDVDRVDCGKLWQMAESAGGPKLRRAAKAILNHIEQETEGSVTL